MRDGAGDGDAAIRQIDVLGVAAGADAERALVPAGRARLPTAALAGAAIERLAAAVVVRAAAELGAGLGLAHALALLARLAGFAAAAIERLAAAVRAHAAGQTLVPTAIRRTIAGALGAADLAVAAGATGEGLAAAVRWRAAAHAERRAARRLAHALARRAGLAARAAAAVERLAAAVLGRTAARAHIRTGLRLADALALVAELAVAAAAAVERLVAAVAGCAAGRAEVAAGLGRAGLVTALVVGAADLVARAIAAREHLAAAVVGGAARKALVGAGFRRAGHRVGGAGAGLHPSVEVDAVVVGVGAEVVAPDRVARRWIDRRLALAGEGRAAAVDAIADRVDGLGAEAELYAVGTVLEVDAVVLLVGGGRDGAGRLGVRDDEEAVRADFSGQRDGDVARAAVAVDADEHEALERCAGRPLQLDEDLGVGAVTVVEQLVEHHLRRRRLGLADAATARLRGVAGHRRAELVAAVGVVVAAGADRVAVADLGADGGAGALAGLLAGARAGADQARLARSRRAPLQAAVLIVVAADLPLRRRARHALLVARLGAGVLAGDDAGAVAAHRAGGAGDARAPIEAAVLVEIAAGLHLTGGRALRRALLGAGVGAGAGAGALAADLAGAAGHARAPLQAAVLVVVAAGHDLAELAGGRAGFGAFVLAGLGAGAGGAALADRTRHRRAPLQAAVLVEIAAGLHAARRALGRAGLGALVLAAGDAGTVAADLGRRACRRRAPIEAAVAVAVAAGLHRLALALGGAGRGAGVLAGIGAGALGADLAGAAEGGAAPGEAAVAVEVEAGEDLAVGAALLRARDGAVLVGAFRHAGVALADLGRGAGDGIGPLEAAVAVGVAADLRRSRAGGHAADLALGLAGVDAGRAGVDVDDVGSIRGDVFCDVLGDIGRLGISGGVGRIGGVGADVERAGRIGARQRRAAGVGCGRAAAGAREERGAEQQRQGGDGAASEGRWHRGTPAGPLRRARNIGRRAARGGYGSPPARTTRDAGGGSADPGGHRQRAGQLR